MSDASSIEFIISEQINSECSHTHHEFMSQTITGEFPVTKYWQECVECHQRFYEREQFHGSQWQGK